MAKSYWDRNKSWILPVGITLIVILLLLSWFVSSYNGLIYTRENVDAKWGNVETQYQRRADLIPNLVETVAGFAAQEEEVFVQVTEARASVGQVQLSADDLNDPAQMQAFAKAQSEFSSAISRLLLVAENYPELKSNENFLALQDQLEGTENRIAVARKDYNEAVFGYNIKVQRIPTALVANMFGFDTRPFYEADEGTEAAPVVTKDLFE